MWKGKIHTCNETWMNVSGICVTVYESLNESDRGTCICKHMKLADVRIHITM